MSHFDFNQTGLEGLTIVQRKMVEDQRGFFSRFFCTEEFRQIGFIKPIVQINHTLTKRKGTVRGLHFQYPPYTETKLVSCLQGEIYDVAVDIRYDSATFLNWHGEILSAQKQNSLLIPNGFAHGFQTLTDNCEMVYLHTAKYHSEAEGGLNAVDPRLAIDWPLPINELSDRDRNHALIDENFQGLIL